MRTPSPPLSTKRPRGLWSGRRGAPDTKAAGRSHDSSSDSTTSSTTTDTFDDDYDDDHSDDSSSKRRRLSSALSDSDTLCHQSPSSRALTPDLCYHASCFPSQILSFPPYLSMTPDKHTSINSAPQRKPPSRTDLEDWDNLKELFARASESYDCDEIEDALPLLRAVIRECHRFLLAHPDPSAVYTSPDSSHASRSPDILTPTEERLRRDWSPESLDTCLHSFKPSHLARKPLDPPTAFHAIFGTALYLMGSIISQESTLALPDEPSMPSTYWLGALDVFETGDNLSSMLASSSSIQDDWRMYVSWGRTLVSLAEEKIEHSLRTSPKSSSPPVMPTLKDLRNGWLPHPPSTAGPFSSIEPRWPPQSPFHAIAAARPPVTRRMSLYSASAHDVMILAMDQFSRGIFHMPHPHYPATHNPSALQLNHLSAPLKSSLLDGSGFLSAFHSRRHTSFSPPAPAGTGSTTLEFSRPKELFTIATEVLSVAERLTKAEHREYWAAQADAVFNQMKMEADMGEWRAAVNAARGRCWLIVGEARAEEIEDALESGDVSVLRSTAADEARDGLAMAVTFLERAKGSATARPNPDQEDLSPLLAEALLTLANLTVDENTREELYARAQTESGDALELELDPPSTAFPAAISSIGAAAKLSALVVPDKPPHKSVHGATPTASIEASPSFMFATGMRSSFAFSHEAAEQSMLLDAREPPLRRER